MGEQHYSEHAEAAGAVAETVAGATPLATIGYEEVDVAGEQLCVASRDLFNRDACLTYEVEAQSASSKCCERHAADGDDNGCRKPV